MSAIIRRRGLIGYIPPIVLLYKDGDEYTDTTGGWVSVADIRGNSAGNALTAPTLTKGSTYIQGSVVRSGNSGNGGAIRTLRKINVSNYNSAKFVLSNVSTGRWNRLYCILYTENDTIAEYVVYGTYRTYGSIQSGGTYTIDITNATGEYYICVYFYNAATNDVCTGRIEEVWLEK